MEGSGYPLDGGLIECTTRRARTALEPLVGPFPWAFTAKVEPQLAPEATPGGRVCTASQGNLPHPTWFGLGDNLDEHRPARADILKRFPVLVSSVACGGYPLTAVGSRADPAPSRASGSAFGPIRAVNLARADWQPFSSCPGRRPQQVQTGFCPLALPNRAQDSGNLNGPLWRWPAMSADLKPLKKPLL